MAKPTSFSKALRTQDDANARAFNAGCDARLAGRPFGSCPYPKHEPDRALRIRWQEGWAHLADTWPHALPPADEAGRRYHPQRQPQEV